MTDDSTVKSELLNALQGQDPTSALVSTAGYFQDSRKIASDLWYLRGLVAEKAGDYPTTLYSFTKARDGLQGSADFLNHFGQFKLNAGQPRGAAEIFKKLVALVPENTDAETALATAYLESGDYRRSFTHWEKLFKKNRSEKSLQYLALTKALAKDYRTAFKLLDGVGERYRLLILDLFARAAFDQAAKIAMKATELWPRQASAWNYRGIIAAEQNCHEEAARSYDKALALNADDHEVLFNAANNMASIGRQQQAVAYYKQSLSYAPEDVRVLRNYGENIRFDVDDPVIKILETLSARQSMSPDDRASVLYTLGKAYDDIKKYNDAMHCFIKAGEIAAGMRAYSGADEVALLERIATLFEDVCLDAITKGQSASNKPVFIVGLPRSGTTLVEQILAGHEKVHAAGELSFLRDAVLDHVDGRIGRKTLPSWEFSDTVSGQIAPSLSGISKGYLDAITKLAPNAQRVIDKQPMNDRYLGFAALAFPGATIIHCVRDLRDTCISCISKNFDGAFAFTDSFEAMAVYAKAQRSIMSFWEHKFPGRIQIVSYEALVAAPEAEARKLIAAVGLDWSDRCLDFAASERVVKTASALQVRQDVYKTSVDRWKRYLPAAEPLIRLLDKAS